MSAHDNRSADVVVTVERGGSQFGLGELVIVLIVGAPWFAPTIALAVYTRAYLNWHSAAVTVAAVFAFILNLQAIRWFVNNAPELFVFLGTIEVSALAFFFLAYGVEADIYWALLLSCFIGCIGWLAFKVLAHSIEH